MNSYIVSVNLRSTWVLANSKNGVSDAMERVKKAVAGKEGIEVVFLYNDFNRAKFLIFSNQSVSEQDVKQVCLDTIKELDTDEINVKINHNNGYETFYAHCNEIFVSSGDVVKKGDVIATVGNTGRSTGPHLHFEIIENGKNVNPLSCVE